MDLSPEQDALSTAIQTWPEQVRNIALTISTEDYIWPDYERKLISKSPGAPVKLSKGFLPTKENLTRFLSQLGKLRPGLHHFSLVIYVRHHGAVAGRTLELHHTFHRGGAVEASDSSTLWSIPRAEAGLAQIEPTIFRVHQAAVDSVYKSWVKDCELFSGEYHNPGDYQDEREMEIEMREDIADEGAFGLLNEEEFEVYLEHGVARRF
jgi:hypothetical protein